MSWLGAASGVGSLLVLACSPSAEHASVDADDSAGGRCTTCTSSGGAAALAGVAAGGRGGAAIETGGSAGLPAVFTIDDLADAPCATTTASRTVVMEPEPLQLVYDQMGHVGDRVFAFDSATLALFTFDAEGNDPSPLRYDDFLAITAVGAELAVLEQTGAQELVLELTDSKAEPVTKPLTLAMGASGSHELAVGPELLLTLRRSGSHLQGELVQRNGSAIAASFDFGENSCGAFSCKAAALWNGVDYTVVWSRVLQDGRSKLSWVRVGTSGAWEFAKTVALTDAPLQIVDMVLVSSGYALLLSEGSPAEAPIIARLDEYGAPQGAALRLLGARDAWGIARVDSVLGVVAGLTDGRGAFRPLSLSNEALSDWVCLDDSAPDLGFSAQATLASDGTGFDFVVRMTDGSATYLRTDQLGMLRP